MTGQSTAAAPSGTAAQTSPADIAVAAEGAALVVTLDRPRALNALTHAMRTTFGDALTRASRDPNTYCVVVQSASPKVFSAGSDVREIIAAARLNKNEARVLFAEEYARNWHCECFSKPTVSLINGLVMGGGVGITLYGTHRVAGEKYRFAMPETGIGLFPDVGTCHAFSRMPDCIGVYLALTGRIIGRADAFALGLATHCIADTHYNEIKTLLSQAETVDAVLDDRHQDPGEGELDTYRATIARCFSADSVEGIVEGLLSVSGTHKPWAKAVAEDMGRRSPLSLKITLRHLKNAATLDLRATLHSDYRIAAHCVEGHDFYEGARAVLLDKDNAPRWEPATLAGVTNAMVDGYFATLAEPEPVLPTRSDMQAARA